MAKSEKVKLMKKKRLIKKVRFYLKSLMLLVGMGFIYHLYIKDSDIFKQLKNKVNELITEFSNKANETNSPAKIAKRKIVNTINKIPADIAKSAELAQPADIAQSVDDTIKAKETEYLLPEDLKKELNKSITETSDYDILPKDFKYGQANTVTDYSWNIDIEPWTISEELRKDYYSKTVRVESSYFKIYKKDIKPWFYMTDDLNYYKEKTTLEPDYTMPEVNFLSSEWGKNVHLSGDKLLGAFINDMPYKFFNQNNKKIEKIKSPSFSKEVKLAITYAPDFAIPLAEIDLLFSNKRNIKYAIERLAFAYYRAGETSKLENLLNQKLDFKYPKPNWGIFRKYIINSSFGKKDNFKRDTFIPSRGYSIRNNPKYFLAFNKNKVLTKEREVYLALIKNDTFKIRAYKKSIEKSKKIEEKKKKGNKKKKKKQNVLSSFFEKYDNNLSIGLKEKEIEELQNYFIKLNRRFDKIKLPVSERYKDYTNEEIIAELAHTNKVLGNFSFFTIDTALYILHERKISEYIVTPQNLLFSTIQFYREYPQKYRAIAMMFWMQKTGMESPQKKIASLYHDYFNAMEAIIYIGKFLKYDKSYFENDKNFFYLRKLMHNSIKLSHDPLAEKYFKSLWSHRFMVLDSFWDINAACRKRSESINSLNNYISNYGIGYDKDYYSFAKNSLRDAYLNSKIPNYELATKMSFNALKTAHNPEYIAYELLKIAEKTDDIKLRDKVVKILFDSLKTANQPVFVLNRLLDVAKKSKNKTLWNRTMKEAKLYHKKETRRMELTMFDRIFKQQI